MLVLCNVRINSHPLNKQQEQITLPEGETLILSFKWRGPGAHCVAMEMEISRNFVVIATTVQIFSSIQKKSSEIFHLL